MSKLLRLALLDNPPEGGQLKGKTVMADKHTIEITEFIFSPRELRIKAGDTVEWINKGRASHCVVADDGSFDSGNLQPGESFSRSFARLQERITYHHAYHGATGSIIV